MSVNLKQDMFLLHCLNILLCVYLCLNVKEFVVNYIFQLHDHISYMLIYVLYNKNANQSLRLGLDFLWYCS